nr:ATP-binding protein [Treponema sp.]
MLCKFAVTDYRGFEQRIEWDLTKARNYAFNTFAIKNKIIKNGIIYGPNGSGKSNFGLAIFDIVNHLSQKWKKPDYYTNFVFVGKQKSTVDFEYVFNFNNQIITYNYSKNAHGVLKAEKLIVDNKIIFERNLGSFSINNDDFPMDEKIKNNLANNANNVSVVSFLLTSYPLAEDSYLIQLQNFVNSMLWFRSLEDREFIGLTNNINIIDEYIIR